MTQASAIRLAGGLALTCHWFYNEKRVKLAMLGIAEHSPECHFIDCPYAMRNHCSLNIKTDNPIISDRCTPSDNWYITGSFVLDDIFDKATANDIDLVAPDEEIPRQLPEEALQSPLQIEMLWFNPKEEAAYKCHNVNLPRLTAKGLINEDIADAMRKDKLITVLPQRKKTTMLSMCSAIKPMVKYEMELDQRAFKIWMGSIVSPPSLKKDFQFMFDILSIESVNWDYIRAGKLIDYCSLAFKKSRQILRLQYQAKLHEVLSSMPLQGDIAYDHMTNWLSAGLNNDGERQTAIEKLVYERGFKLRKPNRFGYV